MTRAFPFLRSVPRKSRRGRITTARRPGDLKRAGLVRRAWALRGNAICAPKIGAATVIYGRGVTFVLLRGRVRKITISEDYIRWLVEVQVLDVILYWDKFIVT